VGACDGRIGDQLDWLQGLRAAAPPPAYKRKGHKSDRRYEHGDKHVIELCNEGGQAERAEQDSKQRCYATQQRHDCARRAHPDQLGILVQWSVAPRGCFGLSQRRRGSRIPRRAVFHRHSPRRGDQALCTSCASSGSCLRAAAFFSIARLRTSPQRAASRPRKTRSSRISASVKPHCWACLMKRRRRAESLS
jgi:hypothetical protein